MSEDSYVIRKDENGSYIKVPFPVVKKQESAPSISISDLSIDDELGKGLLAIHRLMKQVLEQITDGTYDKDTVFYLKTCMDLLKDLKKSEDELLDDLSDEQLEKISK